MPSFDLRYAPPPAAGTDIALIDDSFEELTASGPVSG